jgi:hypothetical protein
MVGRIAVPGLLWDNLAFRAGGCALEICIEAPSSTPHTAHLDAPADWGYPGA